MNRRSVALRNGNADGGKYACLPRPLCDSLNLGLLRVKREFRNQIIAELQKYSVFRTIVHRSRNGPQWSR